LDTRIVLLTVFLFSCAIDERRPADFQIDVVGSELLDTDRVRVCIADVMVHESAVGHGRIAIAGLPADEPLNITVNGMTNAVRSGQTNQVTLDSNTPWAEVEWAECTTDCVPCSIEKNPTPSSDNSTLLLAIHFID
jgi:hypothetical protein